MFFGVGRCKSRASLVSILVTAVLLLPAIATAQPEAAGAKDFPLIKRYEGSRLIGYDSRAFDTFKLLLGKLKVNDQGQTEVDGVKEVEGRHTRLLYLAPRGKKLARGVSQLRDRSRRQGLRSSVEVFWRGRMRADLRYGTLRVLYPPTKTLQSNELAKVAFNVPIEPRYLAATLSRPEGDIAVSLYVATESGAAFPDTKDRVAVLLDVVEVKPMEAKMVAVDAATMAKDISATGKVAIYGLYFDTDKADLKPELTPRLTRSASSLRVSPTSRSI